MTVLCIFLGAACYFDYRHSRIPNWLILLTLTVGFGNAYVSKSIPGILEYACVMAVIVLIFYPLFRIGTLGAGDVKLFGVCAGYLPADKILVFLFFSLLFAAASSLIRFMSEPDIKERFRYLFDYLYQVAESGRWQLYFADKQEQKRAGICLAGPILASILLYVGGIY